MKCTTCAHPQRQAIDLALLAGDATYETLSRQYGPSISALYRHKKHLEAKTRRARARLRDNLSLGFFLKLNNFLDQIQNSAQTADAEGNAPVVLKAAGVGNRIITSLAKMELPLELDTVYRLLASPQWAAQDSLLPTDPKILTDSHQAIAAGLFFSCPELTLPDLDDDDKEDDYEEDDAENDDRDDKAGVAEELSRLLSRLDLDPTPASPSWLETRNQQLETSQTENRKLAAENQARIKREKSAKLPRNSRPSKDNNKQYQQYNATEKTSAKNPCVGRDSQGGASQSEAPPAVGLSSNTAPPAGKPSPPPTLNSPLETRNSELETSFPTLPLGLTPEILAQILPRLADLPGTSIPIANLAPATANQPRNYRAKSAQLGRKSRFFKSFLKLFQKDKLSEKNGAPNSPSRPPGASPGPAESSSLLKQTQDRRQACVGQKSAAPPAHRRSNNPAPPAGQPSTPEFPPGPENRTPEPIFRGAFPFLPPAALPAPSPPPG